MLVALSVALPTSMSGQRLGKRRADARKVEINAMKYARLLQLLQNNYVDTTDVERLTESAIVSLLSGLDPHSVYISRDDVAAMDEPMNGRFDGIGITTVILHDTLTVAETVPDCPARKAGILPGDRITEVEGAPVTGKNLTPDELVQKLRGPKGSKVKITICRRTLPQPLEITVVRDRIPLLSIDAACMLTPQTGYIRLNKFSETTLQEFKDALRTLKETGTMQNLTLDLRSNGGGLLGAAIGVADHFLGAGQLVTFLDGTHQNRTDFTATAVGLFETGRLTVLLDEESASASEVVAGAIQDWDRGVLIGRRSFGKGLVQQPFSLPDGAAVRLTVAHYFTPSGRCIQRPYTHGLQQYYDDIERRYTHGELFNSDSIIPDNEQKFETLKNKRSVYGGGGIMPDIFVPLDSTVNYDIFGAIARQNLISEAALEYEARHREDILRQYATFEAFCDSFEIPAHIPADLLRQASALQPPDLPGLPDSMNTATAQLLRDEMKALIAGNLYSPAAFFLFLNRTDPAVIRAVSIAENPAEYDSILQGARLEP
ncbi:MAG: S41 family peptidase [Bacteroidales bacterium]|nr:S41 family peptidase [Bacteroidales bacterium]